jgi:hypothetical protein
MGMRSQWALTPDPVHPDRGVPNPNGLIPIATKTPISPVEAKKKAGTKPRQNPD